MSSDTKTKECKQLSVPDECKEREPECMINKSDKCQQKPQPMKHRTKSEDGPKHVTPRQSKKHAKKTNKTRKSPKKDDVSASPPSPASPPVVERDTEPVVLVEMHESDLLAIARTIKNKVCKENLDTTQHNLREAQNAHTKQTKECEEILYGDLVKNYFTGLETNNLTHEGLLDGLQRFYKDSKKSNPDYALTLDGFIKLFSQKTAVPGANYKRQHIFEALCRLLLLFNYDRNMFGTNKVFYTSLEEFNKKPTTMTLKDILDIPINVSSKAGIVDIFFRAENVITEPSLEVGGEGKASAPAAANKKPKLDWACECINTISKPKSSSKKYNYIMIQNKYYEVEKTSISHYDVTRIYTLASKYQEHDKIFDDGEAKIVLMVNNEDAVSTNLMRAKQQYQGLFAEGEQGIIGVKRLNDWFEKLLYDLLDTNDITKFKQHVGIDANATKPLLHPRFHQKFIIDCTEKYIRGDGEGHASVTKFVWGAVPRSGKSFMIGGLISNRYKEPENKDNDIVIILGAKTETESQFVDMFETFEDFSGYNIYVGGNTDKHKQQSQVAGKPTIYLFSQEYLKDKCVWNGVLSNATFKDKEGKELKSRFEGRRIDLYFDEIHKGGSTDNSQSVIYTFKNNKTRINIFVMVTATFAKPLKKYSDLNFIGSGNSEIKKIEWSYNDQQYMKKISDATKLEIFINTRTDTQRVVMKETFNYYRKYYGASYLTVLTGEYEKYPELVLLSPQSMELDIVSPAVKLTDLSTEDIRNCFTGNLDCAACTTGKPVIFYKDYHHIFHNIQPVNHVLDFISGNIRNYMKSIVNYPIDKPHTELWFLPDKNLYEKSSDCKSKGCKPNVKKDEQLEGDVEEDAKTGIANIEPLTRGLALMITDKNPRFNDYNVFIVHNTPFNYLGKDITSSKLFGDITDEITGRNRIRVYDNKNGGLSDQLKAFERESYKHGKSVIILTGAKLRLGISLPCADIAFNFDDIKSVDANYQTMFRVLTEREKPEIKKYGYYFDFNKERAIQFLYEYNKRYGESKKKSNKETLEELKSLLFTFNYNGLNIIKKNTTTEVGLYNKLITELRLNEEGYREFYSKKGNIINILKQVLNEYDEEVVKELYKVLKMSKITVNKDKEAVVLREGEKRREMSKLTLHNAEDSDEDADEDAAAAAIDNDDTDDEDEDDYSEVVNHIAENLPTIIALLAMFSGDTKCDNIEDCLRHSVKKILDSESRCTCENIDKSVDSVDILDCFFNSGKLTESEIRDEDRVDAATDEEEFMQDGGGGWGHKTQSKIQKQTKRMKQISEEIKKGTKIQGELDSAKAKLDELKKNEKRKYTNQELKNVMEILLKIITNKKEDVFNSTINNIFDTIREAIDTMPKSKDVKKGEHGLIYGMNASDIEQKITSYLSVRQEEKDKFGEVFTPMSLIDEMFDKLPKEIWEDPDKKWLDPANGIGNFPMVAYMRLMDGLDKKMSDKKERSNHIISKMLYMVEINPKNVKISRRIFGSSANICCADFLNEEENVLRQFKVDKFDVIIGNPPFQDESSSKTAQGGHDLYPKFFINSFALLKENGYLSFINPAKWRAPDKKGYLKQMWDIFMNNNALFLKIYGFDETKKIFKGGAVTRIDYYLIQKNTKKYSKTKLIDEEDIPHEINIREWSFLPNYDFDTIRKILIDNDHGIKVIYSRGSYGTDKPNVQKVKSGLFKHPVRHTHTIKDGDVLYWSNTTKNGHFGEKKVILGKGLYPYPYNDYKGEYGMSNYSFGIPISSKKEGDDIVDAINSDKFNRLISATKWSSGFTDHNMFRYFQPDFYKQFLGKTAKIPSVVREHQQPKTARKPRKDKTEKKEPSDKQGGGGGGGRSRRRMHMHKHRHTRKKGIFGFF